MHSGNVALLFHGAVEDSCECGSMTLTGNGVDCRNFLTSAGNYFDKGLVLLVGSGEVGL
jgi:hypothetical protein